MLISKLTKGFNVNGFTSKAAAIRYLKSKGHNICTLLAQPESNPKVAKNGKVVEVMTCALHLAPFNLSGFQVCAKASQGCAAACLHTAGNPAYMDQKEKSRIAKTRAYFLERDAFMAVLFFEMLAHYRKYFVKQGIEIAFRLNATSDLPFESRKVTIDGKPVLLMGAFGKIQFYDYTAFDNRAIKFAKGDMPKNYHLTFSKKEDNDQEVARVLWHGGNVAMVATKEIYKHVLEQGYISLPSPTGAPIKYKAVDGDAHDFRPIDPINSVIILKAKGDAKTDTTGFTVRKLHTGEAKTLSAAIAAA